jgi:hypothetical protein
MLRTFLQVCYESNYGKESNLDGNKSYGALKDAKTHVHI